MTNMGYSYKKLQGPDHVHLQDLSLSSAGETAREELPSLTHSIFQRNPKTTSWAIKMFIAALVVLSALSLTRAAVLEKKQAASTASSSTTTVPQYFQTTPELFTGTLIWHKLKQIPIDRQKGPTATGRAPFLAQINPAPFGVASFVANHPLETAIPIVGNTKNASIFQQMGNLSPYFPNPRFVASIFMAEARSPQQWLWCQRISSSCWSQYHPASHAAPPWESLPDIRQRRSEIWGNTDRFGTYFPAIISSSFTPMYGLPGISQ